MNTENSASYLSREEWLEKALNIVSQDGGARLRIASLVKAVGVTKGSFYWHFKNRDDFIRSLIDYWHVQYTVRVSDYFDEFEGKACEKLHKLTEMVFVEQLARYDIAFRSWAVVQPKIRDLVKRTDDYRSSYLRMLFEEIGFDKEAADLRARIFLAEAAWESHLLKTMKKSERIAYAKVFLDLLLGEKCTEGTNQSDVSRVA